MGTRPPSNEVELVNNCLEDGLLPDWPAVTSNGAGYAVVSFTGQRGESDWRSETLDVSFETYEKMEQQLLYGDRDRLQ